MKQRKLLFILAMMLPLGILAKGSMLVVELTSGQTANYLLQDKPVMAMEGTMLNITTATLQASYERADIKRFYFVEDPSGIQELSKDALSFRQKDADHLEISGLPKGDRVTISDLSGRQRGTVSHSDGTAVVNLSGQPKGVYLVKVGKSQTIKIVKK